MDVLHRDLEAIKGLRVSIHGRKKHQTTTQGFAQCLAEEKQMERWQMIVGQQLLLNRLDNRLDPRSSLSVSFSKFFQIELQVAVSCKTFRRIFEQLKSPNL